MRFSQIQGSLLKTACGISYAGAICIFIAHFLCDSRGFTVSAYLPSNYSIGHLFKSLIRRSWGRGFVRCQVGWRMARARGSQTQTGIETELRIVYLGSTRKGQEVSLSGHGTMAHEEPDSPMALPELPMRSHT